jgi:hypothetical protein
MLKRTTILLACLTVSGCVPYTPPPSWTLREDGHFRASQRNEDMNLNDWIAMIHNSEGRDFGICLTPAGAQAISDEIKNCHIELESCKSGR